MDKSFVKRYFALSDEVVSWWNPDKEFDAIVCLQALVHFSIEKTLYLGVIPLFSVKDIQIISPVVYKWKNLHSSL